MRVGGSTRASQNPDTLRARVNEATVSYIDAGRHMYQRLMAEADRLFGLHVLIAWHGMQRWIDQ